MLEAYPLAGYGWLANQGGLSVTSEIGDWDAAYHNSAVIPGALHYPALWAAEAAIYRAHADFAELDTPYGDRLRQRLDLFHPDSRAKGLAVFVHGGYWMAFDKSSWSHLAEGARRNGWAVALPSYTLTPEARIGEITVEIGRAIETAAARIEGPIRLAGHSAGGHLVARMMCHGSPIAGSAAERIEHVLSISGLHELHPLMRTRMNDTLGLDERRGRAGKPGPPRAARGHRPLLLGGRRGAAGVPAAKRTACPDLGGDGGPHGAGQRRLVPSFQRDSRSRRSRSSDH